MNKCKSGDIKDEKTLSELLGEKQKHLFTRKRIFFFISLVIIAIVIYTNFFIPKPPSPSKNFRKGRIFKGLIKVKISATGNLKPTKTVDVGSELSGIISEVLVQENDTVKKGQILARLDLSKLNDAVTKSRASLGVANAQVILSRATLKEARKKLDRYKKLSEISGGKTPSKLEIDTATADLERAKANLLSSNSNVIQAKANLKSDETNLQKATIVSPINGVVMKRSVEPGQTVAAAFQVTVLFKIAQDLTEMELYLDVDEADVGRIKSGQNATFTVDAYPSRVYSGKILRVGLSAEEKDGVVYYPTIITVKNDDLSLRPGMTGMADIITISDAQALLVPNEALRFSPSGPDQFRGKPSPGGCLISKLVPHPPGGPPKKMMNTNPEGSGVWILDDDNRPRRIPIKTDVTDGINTRIIDSSLKEGTEIILGMEF
ncbi:MAG: efflux RND transporter periplasmic adaptor subunit [Deltaproteobacteria bacterium]|nr:efflux RND transporter periplasmic adaptor subunit [Deltaproteobacteria bacterium]